MTSTTANMLLILVTNMAFTTPSVRAASFAEITPAARRAPGRERHRRPATAGAAGGARPQGRHLAGRPGDELNARSPLLRAAGSRGRFQRTVRTGRKLTAV